jgi:hypothetical protein
VVDHQEPLTPEERDRLLAPIRERNPAIRRELETAPEVPHLPRPQDFDQGGSAGLGNGRGQSQTRAERKNRRPTIEDFLKESRDPEDEEWS